MNEPFLETPLFFAINNLGVDLLEASRYDDAVQLYSELTADVVARASAKMWKDHHPHETTASGTQHEASYDNDMELNTFGLVMHEGTASIQYVDFSRDARSLPANQIDELESKPFAFLRAIKIEILKRGDSNDVSDSNNQICGQRCISGPDWIVVYNGAIACHLLGLRQGERGHGLLSKAHRLYYVAEYLMDIDPSSLDLAFVAAAIHNNQVCVMHELGMHSDGAMFRQVLLDELREITIRFRCCDQMRYCLMRFCMNVWTLEEPTVAVAA